MAINTFLLVRLPIGLISRPEAPLYFFAAILGHSPDYIDEPLGFQNINIDVEVAAVCAAFLANRGGLRVELKDGAIDLPSRKLLYLDASLSAALHHAAAFLVEDLRPHFELR